MMSNLFQVDIVTPQGLTFSQEIASLIVPSELGYLGVLCNHAPLVASLAKGKIIIKDNAGNTKVFSIDGQGFIEVLKNKVSLILDSKIDNSSEGG